jgi:hypothetical protein
VTSQGSDELSGLALPQFDVVIETSGRQELSVRAEGDMVDLLLVTSETSKWFFGRG